MGAGSGLTNRRALLPFAMMGSPPEALVRDYRESRSRTSATGEAGWAGSGGAGGSLGGPGGHEVVGPLDHERLARQLPGDAGKVERPWAAGEANDATDLR